MTCRVHQDQQPLPLTRDEIAQELRAELDLLYDVAIIGLEARHAGRIVGRYMGLKPYGLAPDRVHVIELSFALKPWTAAKIIAHEMMHASQRAGFMSNVQWCASYNRALAHYGYKANPYEIEARQFAMRTATILAPLIERRTANA